MLKTKGTQIVDSKGRAVILRGVNLGNWLVPEGYLFKFEGKFDRPHRIYALTETLAGEQYSKNFWKEFRRSFITEADIKAIAGFGFNSVRIPFHYQFFISGEKEGFELLDAVIGWCKKYEILVILDMHCAPGGQTGTNIDDDRNDKPELWQNDGNKKLAIEVWRSIAKRYSKEGIVAGYDLLNEPLPAQFSAHNAELIPLYKEMISAIRSVDKKHIIFIEGAHWATEFSMFTEPLDGNMVYSFHKYWNETDKGSIEKFLQLSKSHNVPLWVGETGENANQWYFSCMQMLEENGIGWCFWPWKKLETNNAPCAVEKPEGYDRIISYTKGEPVPSRDEAVKTLDELLVNIGFAKCTKNEDVINSLLRKIPGTIEAEDFGGGGEGISYHDESDKNEGGAYRLNEGVDIQQNGLSVGWMSSGEWLLYDINCPASRLYNIEFRVASPASGGVFRLELDGKDITGPINVINTGNWGNWAVFEKKGISIPQGSHKVKLFVINGGFNLDWMKFK